LGIADVVESYVKLDRAGAGLKGKCPFHNEKTPSFFVSPDRGTYYCFGCGAKGDIFTFVQEFEGLDFPGALKALAARAGVELTRVDPKVRNETERLYGAMEEATLFYEATLSKYPEARNYLEKRGLTAATIKEFRIGFVPDGWRNVYDHLKAKGYSDLEIEKVGLTKRPDQEGGTKEAKFYDRFRGRIMFPISDSGGRVIAFSGRILVDDEKSAKYLNSPDTVLFSKSDVLYGLDKAKLEIRKRDYAIFVEGQMDLIMSHQAGIRNTVAVSGTALSESIESRDSVVNNLGVVKRLSNNLVIGFDSDKAGVAAAGRSARIALSLGMDVKIAKVKGGKDPADLILENPELWKDALRSSKQVAEFYLYEILADETDHRKLGARVREEVLPYIAAMGSNIDKAHFIGLIRDKARIEETALWEDLKALERAQARAQYSGQPVAKVEPKKPTALRKDSIGGRLAGITYWQEGVQEPWIDTKELRASIVKSCGEEAADELFRSTDAARQDLIFQAELTYKDAVILKKDVVEMLRNRREEHLKERMTAIMAKLALAGDGKDQAAGETLLGEYQKVSKELDALKAEGESIAQSS
jgi:DNA primase